MKSLNRAKVFRSGLAAIASILIACVASAAQAASMPDLNSKERIDEGRKQFAQNCVYCHGNEGSGGKAGPLAGRSDLAADYVFTTISEGKRAGALVMPTWKESIDENTRWALTAYVLSLQKKK
jgi:cytochrome c oxidase cbb3-type subunit 3